MFSLPDPEKDTISLRKVEGGTAAVLKFSGKPTEDVVLEKERVLRSSLLKDGLKPRKGCLLARYNDPGRTRSFVMVCSICPDSFSFLFYFGREEKETSPVEYGVDVCSFISKH